MSTWPLSRSCLHTFRSFTTPRSLFDCLVDRFGKPLRHFNALAPLDARLSGSQRNAIVSRTHAPQVCYVLDSWLRHYASDFLADSELFADSRSCWWQRRRLPTRSTALPFHRKRSAYEAPTKKMLKYCGDELDPKSRTLLDYHSVEVAREMALAARADFVLVRPSELMSRARMKDAGRLARAQLPEHQAQHQTSSTRASRLTTHNSQRSRSLCEPSSWAAANTVDSDAVLAPLKAAGDLPTQGRARAGSVSSCLSTVFRRTASKPATPTPSSPAGVATVAGGSPSVPRARRRRRNLKNQGRSRLASMPVHPQFNVNEFAAAGKQVDLETERLRLKALAAKRVVELAREKTPPPPPPPSSEQ